MSQDPASIGRYQVLSLLGRGGMGAVYLVEDPKLKRQLVVKVVHEGGRHYAHAMERFQREAEISARLNHPNIITVHDVGEDPEQGPFIAMEYVKGTSLAGLIHDQSSPPEALLYVLTQAARGLMAAATAGIAHRDVKPENILVGNDGRVKLTDFGVARSSESQHLTTVGGIIGTPSYFAPELLQDAEASPTTDCYALAVTAFEAFTGTLPFMGDSIASTLLRIVNEPPTIPPGMDPRVKAVFLRAFAKRPRDRFSDVYQFMGALVDASPIAEAAKSKMHAAMEGTEVSLSGLSAGGTRTPTPLRTAADLVPPTAREAPPAPYVTRASLPEPSAAVYASDEPVAPYPPAMQTQPRQRNSQLLGLVFAGVGGLVMTGGGFIAWRWWKARPAAPPVVAGAPATTSMAAAPVMPATGSSGLVSTIPAADPNPGNPDAAGAKPSLDQLQKQLKELRESNAREAERLKQSRGGAAPAPPAAQEAQTAARQEPVKIEHQVPTPALPPVTRLPLPQSPSTALSTPPRILSRAAANFPRRAKEMRFESGKDHLVRLSVSVDERGRPAAITVLEGVPGIYGFNEEAISAAKRSTFAPATRGGVAQREAIEVVYVFKAGR
ncbi:MAG: TonB family protein [Holophagaceae bacterium]|nr:TonB family protein [Holophagaceae bacterium]